MDEDLLKYMGGLPYAVKTSNEGKHQITLKGQYFIGEHANMTKDTAEKLAASFNNTYALGFIDGAHKAIIGEIAEINIKNN